MEEVWEDNTKLISTQKVLLELGIVLIGKTWCGNDISDLTLNNPIKQCDYHRVQA